MTTPQSHNQPTDPPSSAPDDEPVLRLADTSDGSTEHLAADKSRAAASAAGQSASDSQTEGTSTGGFDTLLGKLVVSRGLVTSEEVEMCNQLVQQAGERDDPRTLADLLVDNSFVTKRQLERLRYDFEAKKSSQQIPGYKIKKELGAGAMARVFLANQLSLDRLVAIKVLPKKFSQNETFITRFYKEGRAAAKLNHPNIVAAYDVGQAGEHHYFVMEYVDGKTVHDHIVKHKRFSEKDAIHIVKQVARALQHAHDQGFIHRDIKPKNIMISRQGQVKLADLGLARAVTDKEAAEAEAGRAYGTPYYISPEQIRGEVSIGPAADVYGLGATFYHMVTGRVPYEGKNPSAVMHKHLKAELQPPDHLNPKLSAGSAEVIEMMMAKKPDDRYRNARDLLEDLDLVAHGKTPHFAHRTLGVAALSPDVGQSPAVPQPVPVQKPEAQSPGIMGQPVFLSVLLLMVLSIVVNIILLAMLLGQG